VLTIPVDSKREDFDGVDGGFEFLEYDLEELYELLGSLSETLYLLFTHVRDFKKGVKVDSNREDYIAHGKRLFDGYCKEIKGDICKTYSSEHEKFAGDKKSAYRTVMDVISRSEIPEHAGKIAGAIIVKTGLHDFCNDVYESA